MAKHTQTIRRQIRRQIRQIRRQIRRKFDPRESFRNDVLFVLECVA